MHRDRGTPGLKAKSSRPCWWIWTQSGRNEGAHPPFLQVRFLILFHGGRAGHSPGSHPAPPLQCLNTSAVKYQKTKGKVSSSGAVSLNHSLIHSLTHSLTLALTDQLTHSLTLSLSVFISLPSFRRVDVHHYRDGVPLFFLFIEVLQNSC